MDLTSEGTPTPCGSCGATGTTFGWAFSVTSPITVNGIGIFDTGADGLGGSFEAGLYTSAGVLLRSATISDLSTVVASAAVTGQWLFESVIPIVLPAGDYIIGSVFNDSLPLAAVGAPFTTIPSITFTGGVTSPSFDTGLQAPTSPFGFPIFGPTLDAAEIPEPATASLFAFALAAVLARRRLSRQ
ncbi:MAG: PEP-CTERM sorting domain-containing protein [Bryobacteraceae bacterium]|nr:PEP-CTERM sorting domain-containing protein [Bryobacteraceae bacterium]